MTNTHPDTVLVSSAVNYIGEDGSFLRRYLPYTNDSVIKKILVTTGSSVVVHPSTMFRKDAYLKAGGYMPLKKAQNIALFPRMCKLGQFYTFKKPLLNYRLAEDSISTQTSSSSYSPIINAYLRKFSSDDSICLVDVERCNEVVALSKQEIKSKNIVELNQQRCTISLDIKIYYFLKILISDYLSSSVVILLKNTVARIKYRRLSYGNFASN